MPTFFISQVGRLSGKAASSSNASSGRRWNIIPSLSRSRSRSQSPTRAGKAVAADKAYPTHDVLSTATSTRSASTVLDPPSQAGSQDDAEDQPWPPAQFSPHSVDNEDITQDNIMLFPESSNAKDATIDFGNFYGGGGVEEPLFSKSFSTIHNSSFSSSPMVMTTTTTTMKQKSSPPATTTSEPFDPFGNNSSSNRNFSDEDYLRSIKDTSYSQSASGNNSSNNSSINNYRQHRQRIANSNDDNKYSMEIKATSKQPKTKTNMNALLLDDDSDLPYRATTYSFSSPTKNPSYAARARAKKNLISKYGISHPMKSSPTSVADIGNTANVRWSENLHQEPNIPKGTVERPKSILRRKVQTRSEYSADQECPSDESSTRIKAVRISDEPADRGSFLSDSPSAMGFVDSSGCSLSTIQNRSITSDDPGPSVGSELAILSGSNNHRVPSSFEKNIPEEFQRAFFAGHQVRRSVTSVFENGCSASRSHEAFSLRQVPKKNDDDSGMISDAYAEFIEAVASVVVQTAARQFLARRRVEKLRGFDKNRTNQSGYKSSRSRLGHVGEKKLDYNTPKTMFDLAAVRIQSVYRGWWVRDNQTVDHYCALIIQRNFRMYNCRSNFSFDIFRIVMIQAAFRGCLVRKPMAGTPSRQVAKVDRAATVIQSRWRSFACEIKFLQAYENIVLVQGIARGRITRKMLRSWPRANYHKVSNRLAPLQRLRRVDNYTLPESYQNHMGFMGKTLAATIAPTTRQTPERQGRDQADHQNETHDNNVGISRTSSTSSVGNQVARAGLSEIERRRRDNELARKAQVEEEKRREESAAANENEITKMRKRMEMKALARRKEEEKTAHSSTVVKEKKEASSDNFTEEKKEEEKKEVSLDKEIHFDELSDLRGVHKSVTPDTAPGVDEIRNKASSASYEPKSKKEQQQETQTESVVVRGRDPVGGASQMLAGWRSRERSVDSEHRSSHPQSVAQNNFGLRKTPSAKTDSWIGGWRKRDSSVDSVRNLSHEEGVQGTVKDTVALTSSQARSDASITEDSRSRGLGDSARKEGKVSFKSSNPDKDNLDQKRENLVSSQENKEDAATQRRSRIMESLGIGPSFDADGDSSSSDDDESSDEEDEGDRVTVQVEVPLTSPANRKHNSQAPVESEPITWSPERNSQAPIESKPIVGSPERDSRAKAESKPTVRSPENQNGEKQSPSAKRRSSSIYHETMKAKRSEGEQQRLDKMNEIFHRVGLMSRKKRDSSASAEDDVDQEPNANSSSRAEGSNEVGVSEPSASDLIKSWRTRDQTQPKMNGKLF